MNHIIGSEHFQVSERGLKLWQNRFLYEGCFNRHEVSDSESGSNKLRLRTSY